MEVRLCAAMLVSQFDISFAPGESGIEVFKNMTDSFTANPGALRLIFFPRKAGFAT